MKDNEEFEERRFSFRPNWWTIGGLAVFGIGLYLFSKNNSTKNINSKKQEIIDWNNTQNLDNVFGRNLKENNAKLIEALETMTIDELNILYEVIIINNAKSIYPDEEIYQNLISILEKYQLN